MALSRSMPSIFVGKGRPQRWSKRPEDDRREAPAVVVLGEITRSVIDAIQEAIGLRRVKGPRRTPETPKRRREEESASLRSGLSATGGRRRETAGRRLDIQLFDHAPEEARPISASA
jgi:hypothetical protein